MRKIVSYFLIIFFIAILVFFYNRNDSFDSIDDALLGNSWEDVEIGNIIYKDTNEEGVFVMFSFTKTLKSTKWLGIAFIIGNENDGWKLDNSSFRSYGYDINNSTLTSSHYIYFMDDKSKIEVTYGQIIDPQINYIEVANYSNKKFEKIDIIESISGRYYFYKEDVAVRGLSKDNNVVIKIPSSF